MSIVDFQDAVKTAIDYGQYVDGSTVRNVIADNGDVIGQTTLEVIQGGNGNASDLWLTVKTVVGGVITTGLSYLTMTLPTVFAALAPTLGITAGVGIYEIFSGDSDFSNRLYNALKDEGKTVGGKILAYTNGDNIYFDKTTIETFKNVLYDTGVFNGQIATIPDGAVVVQPIAGATGGLISYDAGYSVGTWTVNGHAVRMKSYVEGESFIAKSIKAVVNGTEYLLTASSNPLGRVGVWDALLQAWVVGGGAAVSFTWNGKTVYYTNAQGDQLSLPTGTTQTGVLKTILDQLAWIIIFNLQDTSGNLQPNAVYPDDDEFPLRYPEWYPLNYPEGAPNDLPEVYPAKYPETQPNPYPQQEPAQNPDPESAPDTYPYIIPDMPLPNPNLDPKPNPDPNPYPDPTPTPTPNPTPDPDPIPTPDPIPDPVPPEPIPPDPIDPNPDPEPSPTPIPVPLPTTASSNKLFTVYNPSGAQLDALGAYLWDSDLVEILKKLWQNPLDGVISLAQVYVTPVAGSSANIMLGYLDSGVSAPVVTSQFVTVDCGSVQVKEKKKNATDYAPFTSINLYLPFIGITELDVNECMDSTINVTYKVDVYTGTCLATVKITRSKDMPNGGILYTFNGNCSQHLPLTSGDASGLISGLLGAVGSGLAIASGGGLGIVAGATMLGQSLNHEMLHVSHSGNISANSGIMGDKHPYLIIGRVHGYDANSYNTFYGYPANKTVSLGNCSGFVRVKEIHLKTTATDNERDEIISLLREGVIL